MRFGILVAATAGMLWGYVYATKDSLVQSIHPLGLMASFYLSGAVLLLPAAFWFREEITRVVTGNPQEFFTAIAGILLAEMCIIWSISLLGGTDAGLIEVSYPLWTAFFAYFVYQKTPSTGTIVGGILVMAGILVIGFSKPQQVTPKKEEIQEKR